MQNRANVSESLQGFSSFSKNNLESGSRPSTPTGFQMIELCVLQGVGKAQTGTFLCPPSRNLHI